jgi:hypothetical protein
MEKRILIAAAQKLVNPICSVNYEWILQQILRRCKRTDDGFITDEFLTEVCMKLDKEQYKNEI